MHIVRSDQNADTTVVTFAEMRAEMENLAVDLDPEVKAIENSQVLLFAFEGTPDPGLDIALVVGKMPNQLTFTISEQPYI